MDDFSKSLIIEGLFEPARLVAEHAWEPLAEGVFTAPLYSAAKHGCRAALLHYLPGSKVGKHLHVGFEHILILQGSQIDGTEVYSAGTLVIHKPGSQHDLFSPEGCLALGIWEHPVEFVPED